ncbi:hypothetical protein GCM10009092_33950 [Bowmanella denitrificans]|uniref:Methyltransferase type 11 domain-containing protein n=1 Tax=Bowmanella denitrificans TaxID=366582 RepID=A0ABP3HC21_9ALTE
MSRKILGGSIYVGCGDDRREGFLHCDTRAIAGVDVVCDAWELSKHAQDLSEVYSRHMLEHLTSMEADAALIDWHKALKIGGKIYIVVPDMDFHARQWLDAEWNEDTLRDKTSQARHSFAGFYGWQRECNPKMADYNRSYWDVHKSGYNSKRLKFLLERAGFVNVKTEIKNHVHLVATAEKSMNRGERQISNTYANIRNDHKNRYEFAGVQIGYAPHLHILDLACGIGYGTLMLSKMCGANVTGVDIDKGAVDYANEHYCDSHIQYICADALNVELNDKFDVIVSFETIEHVHFDLALLKRFYTFMKPGGRLICSTPNQDVMPFDPDKYSFHVKHYTKREISQLLDYAGFENIQFYTQYDSVNGVVKEGDDGSFFILTAEKGGV